jgi:hypothetical protein
MAKILILAPSGFGKSTSIGKIPELNMEGLDPKQTYIISATSKPLPFKGSNTVYPITTFDKLTEGRRIITNDGELIGKIITTLAKSPIKNIVLDDSNYVMQDQYMANAKKKGFDVFKDIGYSMNVIFSAAESLRDDQNFIMMAHYEEYKSSNGEQISYRFKTVGKMVGLCA